MRSAASRFRFAPRSLAFAASFATVIALGACAAAGDAATTEPPTDTTTPPSSQGAAPGYVTGTVVDAAGRPLEGVKVYADNTLFYNTNAIGVTDAQGRYKIDVRQPIGTWHMSAQLTRSFEGRSYRFYLHPKNDNPFPGVDGAVRDFDWRLNGETPEGGLYGNRVYTHIDPVGWMADADVDMEDIELTFTPVGPLVDGSTGRVHTIRLGGPAEDNYLPLGKYSITARWAPAGRAPRAAVVRLTNTNAYVSTLVATWPTDGSGSVKMLELDVSAPH